TSGASSERLYRNAEGRRRKAEKPRATRSAFCLLPSAFAVVCSPVMWQYTPRVAVVRGLRTPFAKSGTHYARLSALDLGKIVVAELIERAGINPNDVQELIFGNVIP